MTMLGLVLAGGESSRFGSDKAIAELGGKSLLEHAINRLSGWCDEVAVAGRAEAPVATVGDWPRAGMGPLGGIAAGLRHAAANGHHMILSCGVDSIGLPDELPSLLDPAPAYLASQPVIGLWPVDSLDAIESILTGNGRHSMRAFAEAIGARAVRSEDKPANINTRDDLAAAEKRHGI